MLRERLTDGALRLPLEALERLPEASQRHLLLVLDELQALGALDPAPSPSRPQELPEPEPLDYDGFNGAPVALAPGEEADFEKLEQQHALTCGPIIAAEADDGTLIGRMCAECDWEITRPQDDPSAPLARYAPASLT